jgi:hypothetical protein
LIGHSDFNVEVQSGNLNLEIRSSREYRFKKSAAINAAFELMPTGKGETEESILACASGRRPLLGCANSIVGAGAVRSKDHIASK